MRGSPMAGRTATGVLSGPLGVIERAGNRLPDPVTIFAILTGLVFLGSVIASISGLEAVHPISKETIAAQNLLSADYIRRWLIEIPQIFVTFPPLGLGLVVMFGAGVAEKTGLLSAGLRALVRRAPKFLLTPMLVFAGVMGNLAADAGYVVLIPLGAALFAAAGRHPIAGLAAAFAGVSGGFSANLLITPLDPLLFGITEASAQFVDPGWQANIAGNYYFMLAFTPLIVLAGTLVTELVVAPQLGSWDGGAARIDADHELTVDEKRGLTRAGVVLLVCVLAVLALTLSPGAPLRGEDGGFDPLFKSLVAIFFFVFLLTALVYGAATKTIQSDRDVVAMATESMKDMAGYITLAFVAAQFITLFGWSNLAPLTAIGGASLLQGLGASGPLLLGALVLLTAMLNLFMGSASAKWAIIGPVVAPMLMLLGLSPEAATAAFRVGDSVTNIITPLMFFFPLILVFAQRYAPQMGLGSLIAVMLPYSIAFLVSGLGLLLVWVALGWPLGPGGASVLYG